MEIYDLKSRTCCFCITVNPSFSSNNLLASWRPTMGLCGWFLGPVDSSVSFLAKRPFFKKRRATFLAKPLEGQQKVGIVL